MSKKNPAWIWTAVSYETGQVLSFSVGGRDLETAKGMWRGIPDSWRAKQAHTDEYLVYPSLIPWHQHWQCPKGSGDTDMVEGVNNRLRQRVSYLCRKAGAFARKREWLIRRLTWTIYHTNLEVKKKYLRKREKYMKGRQT